MSRKESIKEELVSILDKLAELCNVSDDFTELKDFEDTEFASQTFTAGGAWAWKNKNSINQDLANSKQAISLVKAYKILNNAENKEWLEKLIGDIAGIIVGYEKFGASLNQRN